MCHSSHALTAYMNSILQRAMATFRRIFIFLDVPSLPKQFSHISSEFSLCLYIINNNFSWLGVRFMRVIYQQALQHMNWHTLSSRTPNKIFRTIYRTGSPAYNLCICLRVYRLQILTTHPATYNLLDFMLLCYHSSHVHVSICVDSI